MTILLPSLRHDYCQKRSSINEISAPEGSESLARQHSVPDRELASSAVVCTWSRPWKAALHSILV